MNSKYKAVLAVVGGGAVYSHSAWVARAGQAETYRVTELEVIDVEANRAFTQAVKGFATAG